MPETRASRFDSIDSTRVSNEPTKELSPSACSFAVTSFRSIPSVGGGGICVDLVRPDQVVQVQNVGILWILGSRRGPELTLHLCAFSFQRRKPFTIEDLFKARVSELGIGERCLAAEIFQRRFLFARTMPRAKVEIGIDH